MLEKRYNDTAKKFPLKDIPVGELVIFKLEPFTKAAIKKDPSLKDSEPTVYGVGMVARHLKKLTRVTSVWPDCDGFGSPGHFDLENDDLAVWMVESAMRIARAPDIEEDEKVFVDRDDASNTMPERHCVLDEAKVLSGDHQ